jgi:signal transduction histidine kinase
MMSRFLPAIRSLRGLLLREIVTVLAAVWVVASAFVLLSTWYDLHNSYISQLNLLANTVATVLDEKSLSDHSLQQTLHSQQNPNYFVMVRSAGKVVIRTPNSPSNTDDASYWFLEHAVSPSGKIEVFAGLRRDELWEVVFSVGLSGALPLLVGIAATLVLLLMALRRGLRPLTSLSGELATRSPEALDPIPTGDMPEELLPVTKALNDLFLRLTAALEKERRFVADASHELRTPLTAIRAQIDTIDRGALDEESEAALERVKRGVDRATRLVRQLLSLARADTEMPIPPQQFSLDGILAAIAAELYPQAVRAGKEIELDLEPIQMSGRPEDFEMMVGNLLENAIRYAQATVKMSCKIKHGTLSIVIEDDGPGVPPGDRMSLFERFRRGKRRADLSGAIHGAGLGLSIVETIARRLSADIDLSDAPMGGLRATISMKL